MRLERLYNYRGSVLNEADDTRTALDPARYPAIRRHLLAKYQPKIDIEAEIDELRNMAYEYPPKGHEDGDNISKESNPPDYETATRAYRRCQGAFKRLMQRLQLNPISGLRGSTDYYRMSNKAQAAAKTREENKSKGAGEYIVIAADVDDMKYLNDKTGLGHSGVNSILNQIGTLFTEAFQIEGTKLFHPHGDEFRVISNISKLNEEQAQLRFVRLLQACMEVSNKLASSGFYLEGWVEQRRVQPTISFGISTTDTSADGVLTHVKTGKNMKYAITVDRDLRFDLGLSAQQMNQYILSLRKSQPPGVSISSVDAPDVAVYESKMPIEDVRNKQGAVVLDCSWKEVPPDQKKRISETRESKRSYLHGQPPGVMRLGKGTYIPLKEPYKPGQ